MNKLYVKEVELDDVKQFNELLRYVFQVTNQSLYELGYEDGDLLKSKRPVLVNAKVFGWFEQDKLVSQICTIPFEVNIHGKIYKMGGITGVGTYPEYANYGLMNELIYKSLEEMKKAKQWISYLFPYSIPYYRRKGWEIISDKICYSIQDVQLPDAVDVSGFVSRHPINHKDVINLYDDFARKNHGALIRNDLSWDEYWRWENEEDRTAAIYYDKNDIAQGYLLYWIEDDVLHIKDMVYLNYEARCGLWNFIVAHFSMVDKVVGNIYKTDTMAYHMKDPAIKETIEPYYMARIVDVENFLKEYPFVNTSEPFHFVVSDSIATWNNGVFGISWDENKQVVISRNPIGKPVYLDIQTLTSMLMSYRLPEFYYEFERLKTDEETLSILHKIISTKQPYFSDYF